MNSFIVQDILKQNKEYIHRHKDGCYEGPLFPIE